MTLYHFQIIDPTGVRHDLPSLRLADIGAVWRVIDDAAKGFTRGAQIRVTNDAGRIVVLVGVSTVQTLRARAA